MADRFSREDVINLAQMCRTNLSDAEIEAFRDQVGAIVEWLQSLHHDTHVEELPGLARSIAAQASVVDRRRWHPAGGSHGSGRPAVAIARRSTTSKSPHLRRCPGQLQQQERGQPTLTGECE